MTQTGFDALYLKIPLILTVFNTIQEQFKVHAQLS